MNSRYFPSAAIIRSTPIINLSRSGRNCSKIANYEKRRSNLPADHTERVRRNSFDLLVDFQIRWAQVQGRSLRKGKFGGPKLNEIATRLQRRKLRRKFLRGTGIVPQKFSAFSKNNQPVFDGENETHNTHVLFATRKVEIYSDCDGWGKKKKTPPILRTRKTSQKTPKQYRNSKSLHLARESYEPTISRNSSSCKTWFRRPIYRIPTSEGTEEKQAQGLWEVCSECVKLALECTETQKLHNNGRRDFEAGRSGRMWRWRDLLGFSFMGASCSAEAGRKERKRAWRIEVKGLDEEKVDWEKYTHKERSLDLGR